MKHVLLLVLLLGGASARAEQWVSVQVSRDGQTEMFVDQDSIQVAGKIRHAAFKFVLAAHTIHGHGDDANKWQSYSIVANSYNCSDGSSRIEGQTVYFDDGSSSVVPPSFFPTPWRAVAPDPLISRQLQVVCAWKPR